MSSRRISISLARAALLACAVSLGAPLGAPLAWADEGPKADPGYPKVGIEENLGAVIPKDMVFNDEDGNPVQLDSLFKRPTILTLVYLRCPGICNKLMRALGELLDGMEEFRPGRDYDVITISFDAREGPEFAKLAKTNFLADMKHEVDPAGWRFLTGDVTTIRRLCELVGFYYKLDDTGEHYVHAGSVMFFTKDAKLVRYMGGLDSYNYERGVSRIMSPFDFRMALNDATTGTERSVMQRFQQICFAYDPESGTYTLMWNRIILGVTLLIVGIFALVLYVRRGKPVPLSKRYPKLANKPNGGAA
jgi:protein SCO1/2